MKSKYLCLIAMIAMVLSSCSVSRHLPEDGYLLDKVRVVSEMENWAEVVIADGKKGWTEKRNFEKI